MREIKKEIQIAATPEKVWSILTDLSGWSQWNPIVKEIRGTASLGSTLIVIMRRKDGKVGGRFMPIISDLEEPKLFRWRGKMIAEFLFSNEKVFELKPVDGGALLTHREVFDGLLLPLFWKKMEKWVPGMLESMNKALQKRAER